jgi:hypothetical protein
MKTWYYLITLILLFNLSAIAGIAVENGLTHFHKGKQGQIVNGTISISNSGKKNERITILLQDLVNLCHGKSQFVPVNSHSRSSAEWIQMNTREKQLMPGEKYELMYTIRIPDSATIQGTYWSLVIVEVADPIQEVKMQYGISIGSKIQYAIQLITDVGLFETSEIVYEKVELDKKNGGGTTLQVQLRNNGTFLVSPNLIVELYNNVGEKIKKIEVPLRKIYPASCNMFEVPMEDIPKGNYDCILVADYGKDLYGMNASLVLD